MRMKIHFHEDAWYVGLNPHYRKGRKAYTGTFQQIQAPGMEYDGLWTGENWLSAQYDHAHPFQTERDAEDYMTANEERMKIALRK